MLAMMQNSVHLLNYRQIHAEFCPQSDRRTTRFHTLRHHGHGPSDVLDGPTPRQFQSNLPVSAEFTATGQYQIAQSG
jgi:hypothetical protein